MATVFACGPNPGGRHVDVHNRNDLASCLIHNGTVSGPRDMIRALETVEGLTYRQMLDGEAMAEGRATLVKLMAEPGAATILVNGCLFLNVLSFRYLTFETDAAGGVVFDLVGDGMKLELVPVEDEDEGASAPNPRAARLMETESFDPDAFAMLDDDDEDDAR
jgi:hypothetical protein